MFFYVDNLPLYNMTASSGLSENVYPCKIFFQVFTFIILLTSSTDVKCLSVDGNTLRYRCYDLTWMFIHILLFYF